MIRKALLTLTLFGTLAAPLAAQPDLPAPKAGPQGEVRKTVQRPLYLSPDGKLVAVIESSMIRMGYDVQYDPAGSQISLWEVATGRLIWRNQSPANYHPSGSFSPDGSRFLCYGSFLRLERNARTERKSYVHVWDTITGESLVSPKLEEQENLQDLVFSPDGKQWAGKLRYEGKQETSDFGARLTGRVWDANTGQLLRTIRDRPELTRQERWEIQGNRLLASDNMARRGDSISNKLTIWSWPELELVSEVEVDDHTMLHKTLSPDGKRVGFTFVFKPNKQGNINIWDVASKKYSVMDDEDERLSLSLQSLDYLSDGKTLVGSGYTYQGPKTVAVIRFWNSETGKEIRRVLPERSFERGENPTYRIRLLPGDKHYVVVGSHGLPELRSLEDGALIRSFEAKE